MSTRRIHVYRALVLRDKRRLGVEEVLVELVTTLQLFQLLRTAESVHHLTLSDRRIRCVMRIRHLHVDSIRVVGVPHMYIIVQLELG